MFNPPSTIEDIILTLCNDQSNKLKPHQKHVFIGEHKTPIAKFFDEEIDPNNKRGHNAIEGVFRDFGKTIDHEFCQLLAEILNEYRRLKRAALSSSKQKKPA